MAQSLKSGQLPDNNSDSTRTTGQVGQGSFRNLSICPDRHNPISFTLKGKTMSRFIKPSQPAEGSRFQRIQDAMMPRSSSQYREDRSTFVGKRTLSTKSTQATLASVKIDHVAIARSEARARCIRVMSSTAATGREKQAADLLMASCGRNTKFASSTAIIAELQRRPLDTVVAANAAAVAKAATRAASDKSWAKAYGITDKAEEDSAPASNAIRSSDDVWARAYRQPHVGVGVL